MRIKSTNRCNVMFNIYLLFFYNPHKNIIIRINYSLKVFGWDMSRWFAVECKSFQIFSKLNFVVYRALCV